MAIDFYSGLFDWEMEPIEEGGKVAYVVIKNAGSSNGGIMPMTEQPGDAPSHWLAYFTVPSCEEAVARLRELGGGMLAGLLDLPAGVGSPSCTIPKVRCLHSSRARQTTDKA